MRVYLNTDGGVRTGGVKGPTGGRTGRGAIGYVIRDEEDKAVLDKGGMLLEGEATVNECEYSGVILGLRMCALLGASEVIVRSDSQLIVNQLTGEWACRDENLKAYRAEALVEAANFDRVEYVWVRREKNSHADQITREFLDPQETEEAA